MGAICKLDDWKMPSNKKEAEEISIRHMLADFVWDKCMLVHLYTKVKMPFDEPYRMRWSEIKTCMETFEFQVPNVIFDERCAAIKQDCGRCRWQEKRCMEPLYEVYNSDFFKNIDVGAWVGQDDSRIPDFNHKAIHLCSSRLKLFYLNTGIFKRFKKMVDIYTEIKKHTSRGVFDG